MMSTQQTAHTQYVKASNGTTFAYRRLGRDEGTPLVLHMHFRGNMDFWDPLLINNLAAQRPVIIFDQSGVGRTDGTVPDTYAGWVANIIALVDALVLKQIDLFGFSMGGLAVGMVALNAPHLIRKLIIAGSASSVPDPSIAHPGIVWPREGPQERAMRLLVEAKSGDLAEEEEDLAVSFFPETDLGRTAAKAYFERIRQRTRDTTVGEEPNHSLLHAEGTQDQLAPLADWSTFNPRNSGARLGEMRMPVLVVNGDNDILIPTSQSW